MASVELNEVQRRAVEHTDGPLLIIAGAGTGKTRVITHRVARLIEKGVAPESILALTFSNKAAAEMAERVETLVSTGYTEMWIGTFHSFCADTLRQHGLAAGIDPFFSILTEGQEHMMLLEHLDELELQHFPVKGRAHGLVESLLRVFSRAKDEMITAEEYEAYAAAQRAALESAAVDAEAGAEWAQRVGELEEVASAYRLHEDLLAARGAMDFGGLILATIQLLKDCPAVLKRLQRHFRHILVDEFQDTNFAQSVLVDMLAADHRNICVVGDDDQSIYRFRGASIKNILDFQNKYPDAEVVRLVDNYRSGQPILDASHAVVVKNEARLYKKLVARSAGATVEAFVAADDVAEAAEVARGARQLIEAGIAPSEIAVLLRSVKSQGPVIARALQRAGVPHDIVDGSGLLDRAEVRDALAWLRAVADPFDDEAMLRVLTSPPVEVDPLEACRLANHARERRRALFEVAAASERVTNLAADAAETARSVAQTIRRIAKNARRTTAEQILHDILARSGYRAHLARLDGEGVIGLANLAQLERVAAEFAGPGGGTLSAFLAYVDAVTAARLRDAGAQVPGEGVKLMTMHAAKGLEFEVVFMAGLAQSKIPGARRPYQIEIPEPLLKEKLPETTPREAHVAEERRLFYVAMTRAKHRLVMSYAHGTSGRGAKPSQFLTDALATNVVFDDLRDTQPELEVAIAEPSPVGAPPLRSFLPIADGGLSLSYSDIDCYQTCPLRFKLSRILHIPSKPSPERSFGTLVHGVLEQFHRTCAPEDADWRVLQELFEKAWTAQRYGSTTHEKQFKRRALDGLRAYVEDYRVQQGRPAFFERDFNLKVGQHWVRGRVDRVDTLPDGSYELIDYKVGKVWDERRVREDLQLCVYQMGAREVWGIDPIVVSYCFVLDNVRVSLRRTEVELEGARGTITEVAEQIMAERFDPVEDYIACRYCDYTLVCPAKDK